MKTKSKVPNNQTTALTKFIKPQTGKLDSKVMDMMLSTIINQIEETHLYKQDQWVIADYEQIQHALDMLYKYLYDQQNSHISSQDAQVFAAYLIEKMKDLKFVVDQIANTQK